MNIQYLLVDTKIILFLDVKKDTIYTPSSSSGSGSGSSSGSGSGQPSSETTTVYYGFTEDFIGSHEKLILTRGSKGVIKTKDYDLWLYVKDGKLDVTPDTATEQPVILLRVFIFQKNVVDAQIGEAGNINIPLHIKSHRDHINNGIASLFPEF